MSLLGLPFRVRATSSASPVAGITATVTTRHDILSISSTRSVCAKKYHTLRQPPTNPFAIDSHREGQFAHRARRSLSSSSDNRRSSSSSCPFQILGVSKSSNYHTVKKAFLKLALQYHPDTATNSSHYDKKDKNEHHDDDDGGDVDVDVGNKNKRRQEQIENFHTIRTAFESIVQGDDGTALLKEEQNNNYQNNNDTELDQWFYSQTGLHLVVPSHLHNLDLNHTQVKELDQVSRTMSQGGLDRGGMWSLAHSIRQNLQDGTMKVPPVRVDAGTTVQDGDGNGFEGARRRRRKRR